MRLSELECRRLLEHATFGHLASTSRGLPVVVPVAIRSEAGDLLLAPLISGVAVPPAREAVVALSVSNLSVAALGTGRAWSVHCQGTLADACVETSPERCRLVPQVLAGWRLARCIDPFLEAG